MNWLRKIFLIGVFTILSAFANDVKAQGTQYINSSNYFNWIKVGEPLCGKGSFYVYVNRIYNQSQGLYYFEIYIWSDSYYKNCQASSTYIDDVIVYVDVNGYYSQALTLDYYLAAPKGGTFNGWNYMAYVYSKNPNQKIKIKWNSISQY